MTHFMFIIPHFILRNRSAMSGVGQDLTNISPTYVN